MTSWILIGCGLLFILESTVGWFYPDVYHLITEVSEGKPSLRLKLVGGTLLLWGLLCLVSAIPPRVTIEWFLVVIGAAMVFKGVRMVVFPMTLRDNPSSISTNMYCWQLKCGLRAAIGLMLVLWGTVG
ncbi:MAG: hypothetical protein QM706_04765 [Nitrospira sp.]